MAKAYDLWNGDRGTSNRAVLVVDREGIIRYRHEYAPPTLPNPADILAEIEKLG